MTKLKRLLLFILILILALCASTEATFVNTYPKYKAWDSNANPLVGGLLWSYVVGTSTKTPTYSDPACTIPNPNPVILNSLGEASVYIKNTVKLVQEGAPPSGYTHGTVLFTVNEAAGGILWTFSPGTAGVLYSSVVYGATQANLASAIAAVAGSEATLYLAPGNWLITSDFVIPANITLKPERGAVLAVATGITLTINGPLDAGPYQIFSCTGTGKVVFGPGAVKRTPLEWWTTNTAPGTTDMTAALKGAIAALTTNGGSIEVGNSTYLISDNINLPRSVNLSGISSRQSKIVASPAKVINVTGATDWHHHYIENLTLDGVGVVWGPTSSDYGVFNRLSKCEILNAVNGLESKFWTWNTVIDQCNIHNCTKGIFFNVVGSTGSGATACPSPSYISNSTIFECVDNIYVDGGNYGINILLSNTNVEHASNTGLKTVNCGNEVLISGTNVHFEGNGSANIENDGAQIILDNLYLTEYPTPSVANIYSHTTAGGNVRINSGMITWSDNKLTKITAGTVFIDPDRVTSVENNAVLKPLIDGGKAPNTTDSTAGLAFPKGYSYGYSLGVDQSLAPAPTYGPNIENFPPGDNASREYNFEITLTAPDAGSDPILAITLADGAGDTNFTSVTLPKETGFGKVRFLWSWTGAYMQMEVEFTGSATHAHYRASRAISTTVVTANRFLNVKMANLGTGTATMQNLTKQIR